MAKTATEIVDVLLEIFDRHVAEMARKGGLQLDEVRGLTDILAKVQRVSESEEEDPDDPEFRADWEQFQRWKKEFNKAEWEAFQRWKEKQG